MVSRYSAFRRAWSSLRWRVRRAVLEAAFADGGLSVTPAVLEHRAQLGKVGFVHAQQHDQGDAAGDGHRPPVAAAAQRHASSPTRARTSRATCARRAHVHDRRRRRRSRCRSGWSAARGSGSLYGSVEAFGKPTNTKGRKGIIPQYRIVSSLRLNPSPQDVQAAHRRGAGAHRHVRPAGAQPRQHDRAGLRHLHALRPGLAQREHRGREASSRASSSGSAWARRAA